MRDRALEDSDDAEFMRRLYERFEEHKVVMNRLLRAYSSRPEHPIRRTTDQAHMDWMDRTDYLGVRSLEEDAARAAGRDI